MLGAFRKHTKVFFWIIILLLVPSLGVLYWVPRALERTGPGSKYGEMFGRTVTMDEFREASNAELDALEDFGRALETMAYRKPQYDFLRIRRDVLLALAGQSEFPSPEQAREVLKQHFTDPDTDEYDAAAYERRLRETGLSDEAYLAEFADNLKLLYGFVYPTLRPEQEQGVRRQHLVIWQRLVLAHEAQQLAIPVSDDEVLNYLMLICPGEGGTVDQEAYSNRLRERGMDRAEFERMLRTTIRIAKLQRMILDSVKVPAAQIKAFFDQHYQTYTLAYHFEPAEPLMQPEALRDDEVLAFYVHNRTLEAFQIKPEVAVMYVLVETKAFYPQVNVADAELQAYYEAHQQEFAAEDGTTPPYGECSEAVHAAVRAAVVEANYVREAERLARTEASRLFLGTSPVRLIQEAIKRGYEVHQTPLFGQEGPIDGVIAENEKTFRNAAFSLKLGMVSRLIKVAQGWCVLEPTQKVPDTQRTKPFSEVVELARTEAARAQARRLAHEVSATLFEQVETTMRDEGIGLVEACSRLGLEATETSPLGMDDKEVAGLKDGRQLIYRAVMAEDWLADPRITPEDVYVADLDEEGTAFFGVLETQQPGDRVWAEKGRQFTEKVLRSVRAEAYGEWFETLWIKAQIRDFDEERRQAAQAAQQAQGGGPMPDRDQ
jgi:hypothetical protein